MKVVLRGKNGFVYTKAIENYLNEKLARVSYLFHNPEEVEARVVCSVLNEIQTVEVTLPSKHIILRAEVSQDDLYVAIDLVIDKLERQIRKHKEKINTLYKQREGVAEFFKSDEELDIKGLEAEIVGKNLVKNKKIELKPMNVEEAAMNMELVDHDFYVFLDKESNKVSIIYKREKDNDYAVIQTE
ncbi:MAG: Ribosome-associated factor [Haloplasmataceae bacterium]|jgi:putative sigma-54 modulation protein|nr:Ribosome-associated factor [Haloplasmataceae bacterium]